MHAVIGLSRGGAARAAAALAQLGELGMGDRATVVATHEADGASAAERALVAAAACAVAEQRRAAGGHALVLLDDYPNPNPNPTPNQVTVCHSRTPDIRAHVRRADIVISP